MSARLASATALVACGLAAGPAWAQAGPAAVNAPTAASNLNGTKNPTATADNGTGTAGAEIVVVTARRKAEKLQNVPLSITALSAKELKAANVTDLEDITFLTPGLTYSSNGQEANAAPVIRGLSDTSGGEATSSNVSIFLDGVYIANPSAIDLSIEGLDRVEIVKGPVSGLYGRNAFTGAINYITAKPTPDFHTEQAFTVGNDGRYIVDSEVSGPIVPDILSGRISFRYSHLDGTYTDPVSKVDGNGYDRKDVLGSLLFTPNEHITIEPVFYYGYDEFNAPVTTIYKQNCALGTSNSYCGSLNDNQIGPNIPSSQGADTTGLTRRVQHVHVDSKVDYGFGTFDVLVGFNKVHTMSNNDFTGEENGLEYALYDPGANNPFAGSPPVGSANLKSFFGDVASENDSSVEARYDSPSNLPVRVGVGGYWYYHIATNANVFGIDGSNIPAGDVLNFIAEPYVTPAGGPGALLNYAKDATRDYSGVVTGEWDILPTLTLSTAVRDTEELQKQFSVYVPMPQAHDFHELTSNEALTWKPTPEYTLYVSAANGAKSGGFNGGAATPADETFQPETDWDYEGGIKASLLQHHLLVNADVFHTDISNLQVIGPPSTGIALVVKNFGMVSETGFELSGNWAVGNGFNVFSGVEFGEPRFGSNSLDFNDGGACEKIPACAQNRLVIIKKNGAVDPAINLQGLAPPYSSDATFNLSLAYAHPTGFWDGIDWFARGDYRFESRQYNSVADFAYYGPRNVLNLHAGLTNQSWTFSGNILNLTNDLTPVTNQFNGSLNGFDAPPIGDFGVFWQPTSVLPEGRTFFFKLAYHY